jgi:hypothetical protein
MLLALADGSSLPVLLAAMLVTVAMAVAAAAAASAPARFAQGGAPLRARARDRRVPRSLDPDAAGRPRPRAPSLHLA